MENVEVPPLTTPKQLTNNKLEAEKEEKKSDDLDAGYDNDFIEDETPNHDQNRKMQINQENLDEDDAIDMDYS